jgi:hypothetical protein
MDPRSGGDNRVVSAVDPVYWGTHSVRMAVMDLPGASCRSVSHFKMRGRPMPEMDTHIANLQQIDPTSSTAVTDLLTTVASFNADLLNESVSGMRQRTLGVPEKFKEWLEQLLAKIKEIVNELSDVASFTITIGAPMAVTVGVTFAHAA